VDVLERRAVHLQIEEQNVACVFGKCRQDSIRLIDIRDDSDLGCGGEGAPEDPVETVSDRRLLRIRTAWSRDISRQLDLQVGTAGSALDLERAPEVRNPGAIDQGR